MLQNQPNSTVPGKAQHSPTKLQDLQQKRDALRGEILAEKKKIKEDRTNRKEKVHIFFIMGSLIDHQGKEKVAAALAEAQWLKVEDRLAVEYYYGLRERPTTNKKKAD